jgi:hypothetical protein
MQDRPPRLILARHIPTRIEDEINVVVVIIIIVIFVAVTYCSQSS